MIATTNPDFWNTITELGKMKDGTTAYNSKRNVAMISQSDIEYIIELENSKSKSVSVDVEKLANKWALDNADETMATNSALNRGFIGGFEASQVIKSKYDKLSELSNWLEILLSAESKLGASDDVIKILLSVQHKIESLALKSKSEIKFGSPNWKMLVNFYMYLAENDRLKPRVSKFNNEDVDAFIKSTTKEDPQINSVNVEYENVNAGWHQLANSGKQGSTVVADKYVPKTDGSGNIIINRS